MSVDVVTDARTSGDWSRVDHTLLIIKRTAHSLDLGRKRKEKQAAALVPEIDTLVARLKATFPPIWPEVRPDLRGPVMDAHILGRNAIEGALAQAYTKAAIPTLWRQED